ncbi:succinyldiaminopimelate transaminase [Corynebacterium aquatimens]|uniref:Succinyldiaminopimelate transaminase n=1 Tax=Corynebacterium aquatimens TaxID=1190508 RepID=A0A931DW24_9CORY|nr:succinyldiaminopimelate transaminase [Corynebacterium aquatimens]MBG6121277.1 succinyldiaminopimelate transaminase [Corynebacterium aquatimens]WJY66173.1 LL-diaminopimelate aminotransferase [Corynebacterium aquatimens]
MPRTSLASILPDFPWDTLTSVRAKAAKHPDGVIDLTVGSPIDPVDPGIQLALSEAATLSGYPQTVGTPALREAIAAAMERRHGVPGITASVKDSQLLPVIGTKEAIAWLPTVLGLRGETIIIPEVAYPTYEVSALLAGCTPVRNDDPAAPGEPAALVYLNSPSNPTGRVRTASQLRAWVEYSRETGAIIASDECYLGLGWDDEMKPISILHPDVCGGDFTNLLAIHSLSKTSNLASYRAGFLAGDTALITELTEVRKHSGLMVPGPIQHAMTAALNDDTHEDLQRAVYGKRRAVLMRALIEAGFTIDHSEAGLYLWVSRTDDGKAFSADELIDWFAERGILAAPGHFYGPSSNDHARLSMTATDENIAAAAARLAK